MPITNTAQTQPFKNSYGSTVSVKQARDGSFRVTGCGYKATRRTMESAITMVAADARFQGWAA